MEQLDKRLLVVLRDGRHLVGVMRSFDQFSNMVLYKEDAPLALGSLILGLNGAAQLSYRI